MSAKKPEGTKGFTVGPIRLSALEKVERGDELEPGEGITITRRRSNSSSSNTILSSLPDDQSSNIKITNTTSLINPINITPPTPPPTTTMKKERTKDLQSILESLTSTLNEKSKRVSAPRKPSEVTKKIKHSLRSSGGTSKSTSQQQQQQQQQQNDSLTEDSTDIHSIDSFASDEHQLSTTTTNDIPIKHSISCCNIDNTIVDDHDLLHGATIPPRDRTTPLHYPQPTNLTPIITGIAEPEGTINSSKNNSNNNKTNNPSSASIHTTNGSLTTSLLSTSSVVGISFISIIVLLAASHWTPYLFGVLCGLPLGILLHYVYILANTRSRTETNYFFPSLNDLVTNPLPSPLVPEFEADECKEGGEGVRHLTTITTMSINQPQTYVYQTWMNELMDYRAENFHLNKTLTVLVTLEGTTLRLLRTKQRINKRVMFNDKPILPIISNNNTNTSGSTTASSSQTINNNILQQRQYNLLHARVCLKPDFLVHKRQWSKKYPICIILSGENNDFTINSATTTATASTSGTSTSSTRSSGHGIRHSLRFHRSSATSSTHHQHDNTTTNNNNNNNESPSSLKDILDTVSENDLTSTAASVASAASITSSTSTSLTLYLFTRTCREKEHWFRLLQQASLGRPLVTSMSHLVNSALLHHSANSTSSASSTTTATSGSNSTSTTSTATTTTTITANTPGSTTSTTTTITINNSSLQPTMSDSIQFAYIRHMAKSMPADFLVRASQIQQWNFNFISCEPNFVWINALCARLFWDFLREPFWAQQVKAKVQAKLKKLHLPYFIDEITVIDIELGNELPVIRRTHRTYLDSFGLWVDLDIGYAGGFSMTLETKVNPLKLRKAMEEKNPPVNNASSSAGSVGGGGDECGEMSNVNEQQHTSPPTIITSEIATDSTTTSSSNSVDHKKSNRKMSAQSARLSGQSGLDPINRRLTAARFSDEEDSVESSTGDEFSSESDKDTDEPTSAGKGRLWRIMDKMAKSPFLAKAMDNKYVKRGMEMVRRTSLVLQVDVHHLSGTVCINIPPPPSDRLWYGFRDNPLLKLSAKPRVGDRNITLARLVEWIENKLIIEIQRLLVFPNMDDLVVPLLLDNDPKYFGHHNR